MLLKFIHFVCFTSHYDQWLELWNSEMIINVMNINEMINNLIMLGSVLDQSGAADVGRDGPRARDGSEQEVQQKGAAGPGL